MRGSLGLLATAVALLSVQVSGAAAAPNAYIPMQDGVRLAAHLTLPPSHKDGDKWPTIFVYDGYAGGSSSAGSRTNYATIHVSIRGTGCSGGQFDLFDRRQAKDGYEVVEWIAGQPWSNGRVGISGHSYGGITAVFTAAEDPPHLDAMVASGLIDDLYRGIVYIGGVPNLGFPAIWTGAYRPAVDYGTGTAPGIYEDAPDTRCEANLAEREAPNPISDPFVNGLVGYTDGPWWAVHSLYTYLQGIDVPTFIGHAWQDEQTGPRGGPLVWEKLPAHLPKRLVASNGDHGINGGAPGEVGAQRTAWLDRFVRDVPNGIDEKPRVQLLLETASRDGDERSNGLVEGNDFPLETADWTRHYLRESGGFSTDAPGADGGSTRYVSGTSRQSWVYFTGGDGGEVTHANGPDEATFKSAPMTENTTIAGPSVATLYAQTTAANVNAPVHTVNTDFFVTIADEDADGNVTYLQRGQLRASHRAVDELRTKRTAEGDIWRPEHPYTHPQAVTPGATERYEIEIFPVAHVFRPGHRMVVKIYSPPLWESLYAPTPSRFPSVNTILHDADHPSSLLLPEVPTPALGAFTPACGQLIGMRCIKPAA